MGVKAETSQKLVAIEAFVKSLSAETVVPFGAVQHRGGCISLICLEVDPAKIFTMSVRFDLMDERTTQAAPAKLRCDKQFFDPETSALEFHRPPNVGEDDPDGLIGVVDPGDPAEASRWVAPRGVDDSFGEVAESLPVHLDAQMLHVAFEEFGNRRRIR